MIRRRRSALTAALDELLPEWRYVRPRGGMFLWAELPAPISTSLALAAAEQGLQITPGPRFAAPACSSAASGCRSRSRRLQLERARRDPGRADPGSGHEPAAEDLAYVA